MECIRRQMIDAFLLGKTVDGPGPLAKRAFINGIMKVSLDFTKNKLGYLQ